MKKILFLILGIFLCVASFFAYNKFKNYYFNKSLLKFANIERKNLEQVIDIKGTIKAVDEAEVYSYARREVIKVNVKEGDTVQLGDTLCEIKSSYDEAYIEKTKLAVNDAEYWFKIQSDLYKNGDISNKEYHDAQINLQNAQLNLKYVLEENNIIKSPINGTVTRVNTDVGKIPLTTESIFTIENLDELEMKLEVNEKDIGLIKVGQNVKIKTKVLDKYIDGFVKKISLSAEDKKGNTTEKIIPVYIKIDNKNHKIISGISGDVEITTNFIKNVLTIPSSFINEEDDKKFVYVVEDGKAKKIYVDIILENNFYVAIKENKQIKVGDMLVISEKNDLLNNKIVIYK